MTVKYMLERYKRLKNIKEETLNAINIWEEQIEEWRQEIKRIDKILIKEYKGRANNKDRSNKDNNSH